MDLHFSGENRNVRRPSFQEVEVICGNLEELIRPQYYYQLESDIPIFFESILNLVKNQC